MLSTPEAKELLRQTLNKFANPPVSRYSMPFYGLGEEKIVEVQHPTYPETEAALVAAAMLDIRLSNEFMRLAEQNRYNHLDAKAVQDHGLNVFDRTDYYIPDDHFARELEANMQRPITDLAALLG